jgi:hypothetical protein
MDPSHLAERNALATKRIVAAAEALAEQYAVMLPNLRPTTKDLPSAALYQREAIAELLETIRDRPVVPPITAPAVPARRRREPVVMAAD